MAAHTLSRSITIVIMSNKYKMEKRVKKQIYMSVEQLLHHEITKLQFTMQLIEFIENEVNEDRA